MVLQVNPMLMGNQFTGFLTVGILEGVPGYSDGSFAPEPFGDFKGNVAGLSVSDLLYYNLETFKFTSLAFVNTPSQSSLILTVGGITDTLDYDPGDDDYWKEGDVFDLSSKVGEVLPVFGRLE